jgi:hypothetical protein
VTGIAFVGPDLYLAQATAVAKLSNPAACSTGCVAQLTPLQVVKPSALAADAAGVLYVTDTPVSDSIIRRYRVSTGTQDVLAAGFSLSEGLWVDPTGAVMVGDDPSGGAPTGLGRLWKVVPPAV